MDERQPDGLDDALTAVLADATHFGHREHLHLAWLAVRRDPVNAEATLLEWLREISRRHDTAERFHATITAAWAHLVAHHAASDSGAGGFTGFLDRNEGLLDQSLVGRHYRPETLGADNARRHRVPPDRIPLPA